MRHTMNRMKLTLEGIRGTLDMEEEKICETEDIFKKNYLNKQRENILR